MSYTAESSYSSHPLDSTTPLLHPGLAVGTPFPIKAIPARLRKEPFFFGFAFCSFDAFFVGSSPKRVERDLPSRIIGINGFIETDTVYPPSSLTFVQIITNTSDLDWFCRINLRKWEEQSSPISQPFHSTPNPFLN